MTINDCKIDLEAFVDGQCSPQDSSNVLSHLAECDRCAKEALRLEQLTLLLRDEFGTETAPDSLRASVDELSNQPVSVAAPSPAFLNKRRFLIGAGGTLAAGIAGFLLLPSVRTSLSGSTDLVQTFFEDFETYLLKGKVVDVAEQDMVALASWYEARLNFPLPPLRSQGDGIALTGGRLCWLLHRRLASLSYNGEDGPMLLYVMKADELELPSGENYDALGSEFSWHRHGSKTGVVWKSHGLVFALIGSRELKRMEEIAVSLAGPRGSKA